MSVSAASVAPMFPQLDAYLRRLVAEGAHPLPLADLDTRIPSLGPYRMKGEVFDLVYTTGPLMRITLAPGTGHLLGVA